VSIRIIEKLKNQQGSSLAFVLIIGMIIMIMVASLLAVANSDFTFTQETVESRQAYIDAKSVIEYGKIEINERMKWLDTENKILNEYYQTRAAILQQKNPDTTAIDNQIRVKIDYIKSNMKISYYIGGSSEAVSTTLSKIDPDDVNALGILTVTSVNEPEFGEDFTETIFAYNIDTQNLRRELDYKVDISLAMINGGTVIVTPTEPIKPVDNTGDWLQTTINAKYNPDANIQCEIQSQGEQKNIYDSVQKTLTLNKPELNLDIGKNNKKFEWIEWNTLKLTAANIAVSTPMPTDHVYGGIFFMTAQASDGSYGDIIFKDNYNQANGDNKTNTLRAKNVIYKGDLTIEDYNTLDIYCENLYVTGKIIMNSPKGTNANFYVHGLTGSDSKAKNIYVGGSIEVGNLSKISWNAENIWVKGNILTRSTQASLEFKGFNYLETGDVSLNDRTQLLVTGSNPETSQMKSKSITNAVSAYCELTINISNLWLFSCDDLAINGYSKMSLTSNVVKINKNLTLYEKVRSFEVKTQYFDCAGMTSITNIENDLHITRINDLKPLNVRFAGGYKEISTAGPTQSLFIGEGSKPATMVVFGKPTNDSVEGSISMTGWFKAGPQVWAESIYFDSNRINVDERVNFIYYGNQSGQKTNLHIRSKIDYRSVSAGSYLGVSGLYPAGLTDPKPYSAPDFKSAPTSTGGTIPGSEPGNGNSSPGGGDTQTDTDRIKEIYY
jgi:hypothetical protein